MATGSIRRKVSTQMKAVRYEVVVDLGPDPATGKRRQRSRSYTTKREAQRGLSAWLVEIDQGDAVDRTAATVADLMADWLRDDVEHHVRPQSHATYARHVRLHIVPRLGALPVHKLTAPVLQATYSAMLTDGMRPVMVRICHRQIKAALARAVRLGLLPRNAADAVRAPRVLRSRMVAWSADEARRFLLSAEAAAEPDYPLYTLALGTGLRRGELLGLMWSDIDWGDAMGRVGVRTGMGGTSGSEAGGAMATPRRGGAVGQRGARLHVTRSLNPIGGTAELGEVKSAGSRRFVDIPTGVVAVLQQHRTAQRTRRLVMRGQWADNNLVFPRPDGQPAAITTIETRFARARRRAHRESGVPLVRLHDLRHTYATLAIAGGANLVKLSEMLGHASPTITMSVYVHSQEGDGPAIAANLGDLLFPAAEAR